MFLYGFQLADIVCLNLLPPVLLESVNRCWLMPVDRNLCNTFISSYFIGIRNTISFLPLFVIYFRLLGGKKTAKLILLNISLMFASLRPNRRVWCLSLIRFEDGKHRGCTCRVLDNISVTPSIIDWFVGVNWKDACNRALLSSFITIWSKSPLVIHIQISLDFFWLFLLNADTSLNSVGRWDRRIFLCLNRDVFK